MIKLVVNADPLNYTAQLVFDSEGGQLIGQLILYAYLLAVETMTDRFNGRLSCK